MRADAEDAAGVTNPAAAAAASGGDGFARSVLAAMERRYACKRFEPDRAVPEETLQLVLGSGVLSPSSFGLEHWRFLVADSMGRKAAIGAACLGQEQVSGASFVVTILVRDEAAYDPDSDFVRSRGARFPGGLAIFDPDYRPWWEKLRREGSLRSWARAQGYIAAANMMTEAAAAGLDSCPIEGFDEAALLVALGYDPSEWIPSLVLAFGYGAEPRREKIRESLESMVVRLD